MMMYLDLVNYNFIFLSLIDCNLKLFLLPNFLINYLFLGIFYNYCINFPDVGLLLFVLLLKKCLSAISEHLSSVDKNSYMISLQIIPCVKTIFMKLNSNDMHHLISSKFLSLSFSFLLLSAIILSFQCPSTEVFNLISQ